MLLESEGLYAVYYYQIRVYGSYVSQYIVHAVVRNHPDVFMYIPEYPVRPALYLAFALLSRSVEHSVTLCRKIVRHLKQQRGFASSRLCGYYADGILDYTASHYPVEFIERAHYPVAVSSFYIPQPEEWIYRSSRRYRLTGSRLCL